jgi:excisionase family DNA binding protein
MRTKNYRHPIHVEPFLDKVALAQRLGTTTKTVESLARRRLIPFVKFGYRTMRFDWAKVKAALDRLEQREIR